MNEKLSSVLGQDFTAAGGIDSVVEIINRVDRGTERNIMESLEEKDPDLAEEIKRRLFVFEDIMSLDDRFSPESASGDRRKGSLSGS